MNESAEDYIKTIYILKRRLERVRSIDIAREMGYSRASVSNAMSNLRKKEIIIMNQNGDIEFTAKGKRIARGIYEKHATLRRFLKEVAGVDDNTARKDACRIEHVISPSTFNGIRRYIRNHPETE